MARLRVLHVGPRTVGDVREEQHILVLDGIDHGLTPDQVTALRTDLGRELPDGIPPILALGFDVDLPGVDPARWVLPTRKPDQDTQDAINRAKENAAAAEAGRWPRIEIDVAGSHEDIKLMIRKLIRIGGPSALQAVRDAVSF